MDFIIKIIVDSSYLPIIIALIIGIICGILGTFIFLRLFVKKPNEISNILILINGATGVGKSSVAHAL